MPDRDEQLKALQLALMNKVGDQARHWFGLHGRDINDALRGAYDLGAAAASAAEEERTRGYVAEFRRLEKNFKSDGATDLARGFRIAADYLEAERLGK